MSEFDRKAATWDQDAAKVARAERVAEAIREMVEDLGNRSVLEVGCGTGLLGFALRPHAARITLADTSPGMLEVLRGKIADSGFRGVEVLQHDFTQGPLPEARYGLVCSLMVLHHIPDTAGALRRFHDILEPGGRLCMADLDPEDGSFHGPGVDVHHGFERDALRSLLQQAGFQDIRYRTPFVIARETDQGPRQYPVFLAAARRPE